MTYNTWWLTLGRNEVSVNHHLVSVQYSTVNDFPLASSLNGKCELYIGTSTGRASPCDNYFTVGQDYVYIPHSRLNGSQRELRDIVEDIGSAIALLPAKCKDIADRVVCYHLYLPCGNSSIYHLPRFVCPDVCAELLIGNTLSRSMDAADRISIK